MTNPPSGEPNAKPNEGNAEKEATPIIGPVPSTVPQTPPSPSQDKNAQKKCRWTQDPGMFILTLAGLTVLVAYTCYTRLLVIDGETSSATQLQLTREALIAANRAWVVPRTMKLTGTLNAGHDATFYLYIDNSGHEPAKNAGRGEDPKSIGREALAGATSDTITDKFDGAIRTTAFADTCALAKKTHRLGVIYPSAPNSYSNGVGVPGKWITPDVVNGSAMLVIKGCITYDTINLHGWSAYCFFYNKTIDDLKPPEQKGYLLVCPSGNDAR